VPVALFALRGDALADDFTAVCIEDNALDFGSAQVNADAIHRRKHEVPPEKIQPPSRQTTEVANGNSPQFQP
jgi:hypothetical protein